MLLLWTCQVSRKGVKNVSIICRLFVIDPRNWIYYPQSMVNTWQVSIQGFKKSSSSSLFIRWIMKSESCSQTNFNDLDKNDFLNGIYKVSHSMNILSNSSHSVIRCPTVRFSPLYSPGSCGNTQWTGTCPWRWWSQSERSWRQPHWEWCESV